MLSKTNARATALALALLCGSCSSLVPWRNQPVADEVNFSFTLQRNLIELSSVTIDNHAGRFILGTANPQTVVDRSFPLRRLGRHALQLSEKESVSLSPLRTDLAGVADAIVGADAWNRHAVTVDYRSGLVTYQKYGIRPGFMTVYQFQGEPMIYVTIDGHEVAAVVDTALPDTLVLPGSSGGRGRAHVVIGSTDFGTIDVGYAGVARARIGNRLLSRFLITIDYGKGAVGLWRDPRIPLHDS